MSRLRRVPRYPVDGSLLRICFLFSLTMSLRCRQFPSVLILLSAWRPLHVILPIIKGRFTPRPVTSPLTLLWSPPTHIVGRSEPTDRTRQTRRVHSCTEKVNMCKTFRPFPHLHMRNDLRLASSPPPTALLPPPLPPMSSMTPPEYPLHERLTTFRITTGWLRRH